MQTDVNHISAQHERYVQNMDQMKGSWHLGTLCDGASDLAANQTVSKSTTIVCIRTHHSSQYKGL